jgi:hypothetical protein
MELVFAGRRGIRGENNIVFVIIVASNFQRIKNEDLADFT